MVTWMSFFRHENQTYPPSLSQMGVLWTGTKSDVLHCLQDLTAVNENASSPTVQVNILDSTVIINMLRPGSARTFKNYCTEVFVPYITSQLWHVSRLDIIWDVYVPGSLKADTRSKRWKGIRRRVEPLSVIPRNWQEFLCINDDKTKLFFFLARSVVGINNDKQIITTYNTDVLCMNHQDVVPCTHEEADTCILLHMEDAVRHRNTEVSIWTYLSQL